MMELQILDWIQNMRSPILDKAMVCITSLGNLGAIWVLTAAVLLLRKKSRMHGALLFIALGISLIVGNFGIKPLVVRMRPFELTGFSGLLIPPPRDFSFPSAHTMTAFASAAVLFSMNRKIGIAAGGVGSAHRIFTPIPVRAFPDGYPCRRGFGHWGRMGGDASDRAAYAGISNIKKQDLILLFCCIKCLMACILYATVIRNGQQGMLLHYGNFQNAIPAIGQNGAAIYNFPAEGKLCQLILQQFLNGPF